MLNVLMTLLLILTMSYQALPAAAHFTLGLLLAALLAAHTWAHRRWYASLTRGKWKPLRVFTTLINLALPAAFLITIVSGLLLAFPLPPLRFLISPARTAHLVASHWALVLTAVHAGLHGQMMVMKMKRKCPPQIFRVLTLAAYALAAWGATLFITLRLNAYLFASALFAFLDFKKPALQVFAEWGGIIVFIAVLTHSVLRLTRRINN